MLRNYLLSSSAGQGSPVAEEPACCAVVDLCSIPICCYYFVPCNINIFLTSVLQLIKKKVYCTHTYMYSGTYMHTSRSSQCSRTGVTKAVVCVILSVGWCI